ncbi:MAG: antitoxin [Pseudolysinimonas sp.]
MRTTLEIGDDVLAAARAIARDRGVSLGEAVSKLARRGLTAVEPVKVQDGFPTFDSLDAGSPITLELVNEFRD